MRVELWRSLDFRTVITAEVYKPRTIICGWDVDLVCVSRGNTSTVSVATSASSAEEALRRASIRINREHGMFYGLIRKHGGR